MLGEWFVSGDRYERRADGAYAYVGRVDDMLKVSGLWVSPIDMEHVLMEHPQVGAVGVVGVDIDGATRIAAYVECAGDRGGDDARGRAARRGARSGCGATSIRTSCASSTICRGR